MIAKYSNHMRAIQGIFLDWQKFNRTPAFAQRVLLAAEPRVDQPQNTKRRSPFRLLLHCFSWTARAAANAARALSSFLVIRPITPSATADGSRTASSQKRCLPTPAEHSAAADVPLGQRADHPGVGHTLDCLWIGRSNFFDRVAQRPRDPLAHRTESTLALPGYRHHPV